MAARRDTASSAASPSPAASAGLGTSRTHQRHAAVGSPPASVNHGPPSPLPPPLLDTMASSQNLPAVLNDPGRGKQKDFFTRTWGDTFTETRPIPPSPHVCQLPPNSFDKYLRKLRRHRRQETLAEISESPTKSLDAAFNFQRVFMDPNFDLTKPETFASIFNISKDENFARQVESGGRLVQEKLSHQLDLVEVSIANQVAQKSHHFFQVMTYHDALMTQLKTLVDIVRTLRSKLRSVDENSLKPSLELCRLKRRLENASKVTNKLSLMSFLHQTQPTIQLLLTSSEFSGALDLITTSCEILSVDLKGVISFRHLSSQLHEIQTAIGRMLLQDFQTFIASEINKETIHIKATSLNGNFDAWKDFDTDQLRSVIFGLLRQNSYTFLEALEDARYTCKSAMTESDGNICRQVEFLEVTISMTSPGVRETTLTNLVAEFARTASCEDWIDLFDVLTGSLLVLLNRIFIIHSVINEAIRSANAQEHREGGGGAGQQSSTVMIPQAQLESLLSTNGEVLINVCDQMHERCARLLTQRAKPGSSCQIKTEELTSIGLLVSIFSEETKRISGKHCTGLQLSLQSQSVLYVQAFHEENRLALSTLLDKETWKKTDIDFSSIIARVTTIPSIKTLFFFEPSANSSSASPQPIANGLPNGSSSSSSSVKGDYQGLPGQVLVGSESYFVAECIPDFLKMLAEYCNLCSMLPTVTLELGLKTAELVKFLNSRICQLLLGLGAISVSGLKTITIRNLALALRSIQLVVRVIPYVLLHFQTCYSEKSNSPSTKAVNGASPGTTKAEMKQFEVLQRQFDQAVKHLKNHGEELYQKIVFIVTGITVRHVAGWKCQSQVPSSNFKALCKQLTKLYESTEDIWSKEQTKQLFTQVHAKLLDVVQEEIKVQNIHFDSAKARSLQSELTFYGQSILRLNILPVQQLSRERFEALWGNEYCDSDNNL